MVTCNDQDLTENKTYIEHPKLMIEVLSPSTKENDRRNKLLVYTRCASIQEYVLVNWDCMLIQRMTRKDIQEPDQMPWVDHWYGSGESVELETIGLALPVDDIYEKVIFPPNNLFRKYRQRNKREYLA